MAEAFSGSYHLGTETQRRSQVGQSSGLCPQPQGQRRALAKAFIMVCELGTEVSIQGLQ